MKPEITVKYTAGWWEIASIEEHQTCVCVKLVRGGDTYHCVLPTKDSAAMLSLLAKAQACRRLGKKLPPEELERFRDLEPVLQDLLGRLGVWGGQEDLRFSVVSQQFLNHLRAASETIRSYTRGLSLWLEVMGDQDIRSIQPTDIRFFLRKLLVDQRAGNTMSTRLVALRAFFNWCIKHGLCENNPAAQVHVKRERSSALSNFYVPAEVIHDVCNHVETYAATFLALCRFQGLRCESEALELRWDQVDLAGQNLHITDTKRLCTRIMPIFQETLYWLHRQRAEVPNAEYVITRPGGRGRVSRRRMSKITIRTLYRLGYTVWPRIFHSLRASCETDLMRHFPPHVVCTWIGNSFSVAQKHYLMTCSDELQKAKTQTGLFSRSGAEKPAGPGSGLPGGVGRPPLRLVGDEETA